MPPFRGTKQEVLALSVFVKLMRAGESVSARVHRDLAQHNLTISQFGVLEALYHLGQMCQRDLARKILKSSGNLTMVIDNLEKRSLVTRQRDLKDRRYFVIRLTSKGRDLIQDIFPDHARRITATLSVLDSKELRELGRLCKKLKTAS